MKLPSIAKVRASIYRSRLPAISFITGFALLTFELAAARILAPTIGSSTYVWTSVIGVIIAALSLGFYAGGRIADSRAKPTDVPVILLLAAGLTLLTLLSYEGSLQAVVEAFADNRMQAVVAALLLFAPTSFLIGITSPYLAKLNVTSLTSTGKSIASLDMFNAIGGILGTFTTGFILFGFIGSHQAIGLVALLLVAASWLIRPRTNTGHRLVASAVILLGALTPAGTIEGVIKIDSASAHYEIVQGFLGERQVTGLLTGPSGTQSAVYTNGSSEPVFWYTKQMTELTIDRKPTSVLVLGGGAFTMPQYLSSQLPDATIDVVEIDPRLHDISRDYFGYTDPSNVSEHFTDARTFVNQSTNMYDVILVDVYGDTSIPFTFITEEYAAALSKLVAPGGVVIANVIGGLEGRCRETLFAVDAAYRSQLPYVLYAKDPSRSDRRGNYVTLYSKAEQQIDGMKKLDSNGSRPYTDNFAPAERLYYECAEAV